MCYSKNSWFWSKLLPMDEISNRIRPLSVLGKSTYKYNYNTAKGVPEVQRMRNFWLPAEGCIMLLGVEMHISLCF